jgi:pimeloyl-ACP methyl ester carboxylesterase
MKQASVWGLLLGIAVGVAALLPVPGYAQTAEPCVVTEVFQFGTFDDLVPCDEPFGELNPNPNLTLQFGTTTITDGATLPLVGQSGQWVVDNVATGLEVDIQVFRHTGGGTYRTDAAWGSGLTFTATGTYTVVLTEFFAGPPVLVRWWQPLVDVLAVRPATAHAAAGDVTAITFTVVAPEIEPEPTGPSSVLFLPGFQSSRLYTKESDGTEKLLWEPDSVNDDADILRLAMDESGESIADVYVRDVIDYAPQTGKSEDAIYGEFITFLDNLVATGTIQSYESFAYDWRYDVYDIVANGVQYENERRYLNALVETLAADSFTGQVTIVAHSNGGLLGKALIDELERQGREDLIDSFIMVGTPQLGTPKAIGSLLHGTDQGLSFDIFLGLSLPIISDAAVREAARNMPGAYGLLPGQTYFDTANDIVAIFDTSDATEPWRSRYGNTLNTQAELDDFLLSSDNNRANVLYQSTNEAIVANETVLTKARANRSVQDGWTPPNGIETTSIVGTGRNTISGFWYESFQDQICDESTAGCVDVDIYKPVPIISQRGDQTVMSVSAAGVVDDIEVRYVDVASLRSIERDNLQHKNLTESVTIQTVIANLLLGTTSLPEFTSTTEPEYEDQQLLLGLHSPVYLYIEDALGRRTGQLDAETVAREIPEVEWFRHASSSYITVPLELEYTVYINGYDEGFTTFTSHTITKEGQSLQHKLPIGVVTASTSVTISYANERFAPLAVDKDGDGVVEYQLTLAGEKIIASAPIVSYQVLKEAIAVSIAEESAGEFLLGLIRLAERFAEKPPNPYFSAIEYRLLNQAVLILNGFAEHSILSETNSDTLAAYVRELQAKILR